MVDINKSVIIVLVVIKIGVEFPSSILVFGVAALRWLTTINDALQ
jgi:hypothetical protein